MEHQHESAYEVSKSDVILYFGLPCEVKLKVKLEAIQLQDLKLAHDGLRA